MVKKVTVWEASDGFQLPTEEQANFYENKLELQNYIDDNPLYSNDQNRSINGADFLLWVKKHPRIYVTLLPEEDVK